MRNLWKFPLFWGVVYFALLILFAGVYCLVRDGFAYSSSEKASVLQNEKIQLGRRVETLLSGVDKLTPGYGFKVSEVKVPIGELSIKTGRLSFLVVVKCKNTDPQNPTSWFMTPFVVKKDIYVKGMALSPCRDISEDVEYDNQNHPCFGEDIVNNARDSLAVGLRKFIGADDFDSIFFQYWNALNGYPYGMEMSGWRMLYLSAVTITTLGYGDIAPIHDLNRILVGVEAVVGIIVMGCFLNALASRRKNSGE